MHLFRTHVNNVNNYPKKISIFNPSSNTLFNKRERFNSDPHDKRKVPQDNQSDFNQAFQPPQEIWIDPKLVNYSLTSKLLNLKSPKLIANTLQETC
jgi:hypothetical protein